MKTFPHILAASLVLALPAAAAEKLKDLIVDGQNNHAVWPKSTIMMKQYLEDSGLFEVDVVRTRFISNFKREQDWLPLAGAGESEGTEKPVPDPDFSPDFTKYAIVVSNFGKGRVFHTTLGHDTEAFEGVGFITTFLRGSEWAATGKVTQPIPKDFPCADRSSSRGFELRK